MNATVRQMCINLGVTFVTLLIIGFLFEFVIFKYVLKAAELPRLDASGPVIKYQPNQTGVYRLRNEIAAQHAINGQGWNTGKGEYLYDKNKPRVAIIGDSYIEALQVDLEVSIAEQLERLGGGQYEVYRFGMSGAPLSQYLHMLRDEVLPYHPDLVIFNLVHNDFDESYDFKQGAYTSAFLKLKMDGSTVVGEIPPQPLPVRWFDPIRRSNAWRYLGVRQQVRFQNIRNLILGAEKQPQIEANIVVDSLGAKDDQNAAATEYVFRTAKELCGTNGADFMVVMDGVRQLIYKNPDGPYDWTSGALKLNAIVRSAAEALSIPSVDLQEPFALHYRKHGQKFEFIHDGHWNELGHEVAAKAVFDNLKSRQAIPEQ